MKMTVIRINGTKNVDAISLCYQIVICHSATHGDGKYYETSDYTVEHVVIRMWCFKLQISKEYSEKDSTGKPLWVGLKLYPLAYQVFYLYCLSSCILILYLMWPY